MFKSKKTYLIRTITMLTFVVFLITDIIINWSSKMQTNQESLFFRIILSVLFTFRATDYFLKWRNHGKSLAQQE